MPEIVEVKRYIDFINENVSSHKLINFNIINGRYKKNNLFDKIKFLLPLKLINVNSKGKLIYFEYLSLLNSKTIYLLNTLGLVGGWFFKFNLNQGKKDIIYPGLDLLDYNNNIENYFSANIKYVSIEFIYDHGILYFFDMLSFGTMKLIDTSDELNKKLQTLGPDIMDINTTFAIFYDRLQKQKNKKIGIVLLNQKIISGLGNYLRADSLWLAKINPFRKISSLSNSELKKLFNCIRKIVWGLYNKKKGLKLKILTKTDKISYDYKRYFFIYGQDTDIYNNNIIKEELYEGSQKRFIYWVPNIQK